jgi:hypothetical protein
MRKVIEVQNSGLLSSVHTSTHDTPIDKQQLTEKKSLGEHALAFHFSMLVETAKEIYSGNNNTEQFKLALKSLIEFAREDSTMSLKNFSSFKSYYEDNQASGVEVSLNVKNELINFINYHASMLFVPDHQLLDNERMDKSKSAEIIKIMEAVLSDTKVNDNLNIYVYFAKTLTTGYTRMQFQFSADQIERDLGVDIVKRYMPISFSPENN